MGRQALTGAHCGALALWCKSTTKAPQCIPYTLGKCCECFEILHVMLNLPRTINGIRLIVLSIDNSSTTTTVTTTTTVLLLSMSYSILKVS